MTRARLEVSPRARADLMALARFIAQDNPAASRKFLRDFGRCEDART